MSFREKYKGDNELIKPDENYLKQLTKQMKAEEKKQGGNRRRTWVSAAAVAAVILLAGLLGYQMLLSGDKLSPDETVPNLAGVASGSAVHDFSASGDEERYEQLVLDMESELSSLEKSRSEDFAEAEAVPEAEAEDLLEKMKRMTYRDRTKQSSGETSFYRIHDSEGGSVIFTLENDRIVRLLESDGELYM